MLRPSSSPPSERRRLDSAANQAAGASSATPSDARQLVGEASEPSLPPCQVAETQDDPTHETSNTAYQTRADHSAGNWILERFKSVAALTEVLRNSMDELLASGILDMLSPHLGGIVRDEVQALRMYTAAEQIVLVAMAPWRVDVQQRILAFVENRPELHSCLHNPPQLVQGISSNNSLSRCNRSGGPANFALRKTLRDELQPVDEKLHSDVLNGCLRDTRVEVLKDLVEVVEGAISSEGKQLVWLKGLVGAGKTTVISTVAAKLGESLRTAQFYCSRADTARSDPRRILPTIAYALGTAESAIGRDLEKAIQSQPKKVTAPSEQLSLLVYGPLKVVHGPTVIFVDGLDECASDDALDQFLAAVTGEAEHSGSVVPTLVFVVSSRPERRILTGLSGCAHTINLDDVRYHDQTQADTRLYIRHRLPEHKLCDALATLERPISYEAAIAKLAEVVGGRFVIAALMCSTVLEADSDTTFLSQTLRHGTVSAEVVSLYEQFYTALKAIFTPARWQKSRPHQNVRSVLATLCCMQKPLSSPAIARLCDVTLGSAEAILRALAPLLVHPSGCYTFFHASVADFLESKDAGDYRISASDHHGQLFSSCCEVLRSQLDFNVFGTTNSTTDLDQLNLQAVSPELAYAFVFWTHHLVASSLRPEVAALEVATLLQSKFLFWLEVLSGLRRLHSDGVGGLDRVSTFLGASGGDILRDCQICLHQRSSDISSHPCRIYLTVLPWIPAFFREHICSQYPWILPASPRVLMGAPSRWVDELSIWHLGSAVSSVAWSPNGRLIAVGKSDGAVEMRDPRTGEQYGSVLCGHFDSVNSVAFSLDSSLIASGSFDHTICLWDVDAGALHGEPLAGHMGPVDSVAFSPDGSMLASGSWDKTIRLWDIPSGAPHSEPLRGHSDWVPSIAFSPDGSRIASGSRDRTVRLWDTKSGAPFGEPLKGHTDWVASVAFSTDGSTVASASDDRTVRLWDAHSRAPRSKVLEGHASLVRSVAFSPDGSTLASSSMDGMIRIWDAGSGASHGDPLRGHTGPVSSIAFSPDGSRIVSGSGDETVRLWDAHSRAAGSEPLDTHTGPVYSIAFSPDGVRFVSGSADNTVRLWDATSGAPCGELEGHSDRVYAVAFSSDGSTIASGSDDGDIRLWDAHSGAPRGTALEGHTGPVRSVAFSPDSSRIASGSADGTVRLWDANSGAPCSVPFEVHTNSVASVAFSLDGSKIASGPADGTIRLWDAVAGVPSGDPLEGHDGSVCSIAFSPDGLTLASGSDDETVRLWSVETGVPRCEPLEGHTDWVNSVAFSEDGTFLFSLSVTEMLVWDLSGWVPTLCDTEPLPVRSSALLTPEATLPLPSGYNALAFSPGSRTLAGCWGPDGCQIFALCLPSYNPWKTLCEAHAQSHRGAT